MGADIPHAKETKQLSMVIYTKTGDRGTTSLFGGKRVTKTHPQIIAAGVIDEVTSLLGLVATKLKDKNDIKLLHTIQYDLYQIMASVAGYPKAALQDLEKNIALFERTIDEHTQKLPELHQFILPGGTELSALFHVLRTHSRRAERAVVGAFENHDSPHMKYVLQYLNRLSDLFFTLARTYGKGKEIKVKL